MRIALSILVLAAACSGRPAAPASSANVVIRTPPATEPQRAVSASTKPVTHQSLASIGLDPDALDRTADPCDDFYQFACGGWIKRTEIPADEPAAMRSFNDIANRNLTYEHDMLEQIHASPCDDPIVRQLGAFYRSCMDEPAIEKAGLSALRPLLGAIDRIKDTRSLTAALAMLQAAGVSAVFVLEPIQDSADARNVIARIDQGGLSLPDRGHYLADDESSRQIRSAYASYAEAVLTTLGHPAAKPEAADIVALETEIARLSMDPVARRDPQRTYHKLDRAGVARLMPAFDWEVFWAGVGLKDVKEVTVTSPELLVGLDHLIGKVQPEAWRAYLALQVIRQAAPMATRRLEELGFQLDSALTSQPEMPPRWKRCVRQTETALGDLVGQVFVRDRFGGASKAWAEDQVHAIVAAMAAELDAVPWMDPVTKDKARAKLAAMTYQIGYPRTWKTYPFKLDPKTWTANLLAARKAERARRLAKIGKPVDRDDWEMSASQVAAYNSLRLNLIVIPAGILQPPFYSVEAALPVNLGGAGVVIGHELSHGFDNHGAQFDSLGNLVDWWQPDTKQQFQHRTQCVIDQYSSYEVSGGTKLNGALSAGDNIADIGGVKLALAAYRQLRAAAPDTVVADGFTEDQQFFLGFGQAQCAKLRPDFEQLVATTDLRAPPKWVVNGALSATPDFAKAFRCRTGSSMVPAKPCVIW